MTKVYTGASMSLDGYISGPAETGFEHSSSGTATAMSSCQPRIRT
jgi:hypothetical protein